MFLAINNEIDNQTTLCQFSKKCLTEFKNTMCCEVIDYKSFNLRAKFDNTMSNYTINYLLPYLLVSPVSLSKNKICLYKRKRINNNNKEIDICSCPIRIELFKKYGK
jgi:hypothetical protein